VSATLSQGPLGYLHQDPSEAAKILKDDPSLRDKSKPLCQETMKSNASDVVSKRGGDVSDKIEVLVEYILQFGLYKGKAFRPLLENNVGYTIYLIKHLQEEMDKGVLVTEGHSKDNLLSFVEYSLSHSEINALLKYEAHRKDTPPAKSEDDNLFGFGVHAENTWGDIWTKRADGYDAFIMSRKCAPGTEMHNLQRYLIKKSQGNIIPSTRATSTVSVPPPTAPPSQQPGM
ncbi:hypothetical protein HHUSO_G35296, partial [Huso huso]